MDPSTTPSLSEPESDFDSDVDIEKQNTNSDPIDPFIWGTGVPTMAAIMLVVPPIIDFILLILFLFGSVSIAVNIWNWLFPPIPASSDYLKGYQRGFSKAAEKATEAIANLTIPQEATE